MSERDLRHFVCRGTCTLSAQERLAALVLAEHADWNTGEGFASQEVLARGMGLSVRQVQRLITKLQELSGQPGAPRLAVWRRFDKAGDPTSNGYCISPPGGDTGVVGVVTAVSPGGDSADVKVVSGMSYFHSPQNLILKPGGVVAEGPTLPPIGFFKEENSVAGQVTPRGSSLVPAAPRGPGRPQAKSKRTPHPGLMLCSGFVPGPQQLEAVRSLGLEPESVLEAFRGRHALEAQEHPEAEWKRLFGGWARGAARIAQAPKRPERPKAPTDKERLEIIEALCKKEGISAYALQRASQDRKVHAACAKLLRIPREDLAWTPGQIEALEETLERLRQ